MGPPVFRRNFFNDVDDGDDYGDRHRSLKVCIDVKEGNGKRGKKQSLH